MCSERRKTYGCGWQKPKSSSSAIFGVEIATKTLRTQAVCRPSLQPNRQGKFELFAWTLSPIFFIVNHNWTFRLPPKRQMSILLKFVFPFTNLLLTFVAFACFATTRVTMRFHAKNTECSTGLYPVYAALYCWPCVVDGRSRDYNVTTKISWLHRLPNLLSNGAPLTR